MGMFSKAMQRVVSPRALSSPAAQQRICNFSTAPRKTTALREMFYKKELDFLMEAHNGLSAKIVQEAGFGGIWASGLSLSHSLGSAITTKPRGRRLWRSVIS